LRTVFVAILFFTLPVSAISAKSLSRKLSFKRGVYKAVKGSSTACVSGVYELFNAHGKVFHMQAGDGILVSNLHTRGLRTKEGFCKIEYATKVIKNGFINSELMECVKPTTFYKRVLKMQRKSAKIIEYRSVTQNSKKSKKKSLRCRLKLVKK